MNRQYRRRIQKMQEKEYKLFVKKNKNFLDAIKGDAGSIQAMERIKELLDNYGKQEQTLEGGEESVSPEEERAETQGNSESIEQVEVGS
jgi:hypothetical protein